MLVAGATSRAGDLGTAFTYQGSLENPPGTPVTDTCDFRFGLFDAATGGVQRGTSPQTKTGVGVASGVFVVETLDFGGAGIDGTARWLAIEIKCTGDPGFTLLAPRVRLSPVPHALALPGLYTQQNLLSPNVIGGFSGNSVTTGVAGATISGGGQADPNHNRVSDLFGTIGGGHTNQAGDGDLSANNQPCATVGGGRYNTASSADSTVGGGISNNASADASTVAGGTANSATGYRSTVGGGDRNTSSGPYSTIAGGFFNTASMGYSTTGGGNNNRADGIYSTVGGGLVNTANGDYSTVGGGHSDAATGDRSTVGGGELNTASGDYSTVGGGQNNIAYGTHATVPGGYLNSAAGAYSFAAGRSAKVRDFVQVGGGDTDGDEGTFVWADATGANFTSDAPNRFLVRASQGTAIYSNAALTAGVSLAPGAGAWSAVSDKNFKENFAVVDVRELLERLAAIPITTWNYQSQEDSIRHIGPMGQDFFTAFGVGEVETRISTIDADGVALAAIQGLYEAVQEKNCEIEGLGSEISNLKSEISDLKALVGKLAQQQKEGGK